MAHNTTRSSYTHLISRINRFPQGAPPSELLYKILAILFSEQEAELVSMLPIKPFTAKKAAKVWKKDIAATTKILDALAGRAILVDVQGKKGALYTLPPPMAGFFEFSLMRVRSDIDQSQLAKLFYQYLNVEEDFVRDLFQGGDTGLGRVFVNEQALSQENMLHVLDYERATEVIDSASHIGISLCYCRHKAEHVGKDCDAPKKICMTFNTSARSLIKNDFARQVEPRECLELLEKAYDHNLVQFGENVREQVNFICNCCGCCCEALLAAQRLGFSHSVHTTNFLPRVNEATCKGCGKCVKVCPVNAMSSISASTPDKPKKKKVSLNQDTCLGCGVCQRVCPSLNIEMISRPKRVITPLDSVHRSVVMAIERGKLQNLIFDNQQLMSHRILGAILGVIVKLPPVKRLLALEQVKSRYIEAITTRMVDI